MQISLENPDFAGHVDEKALISVIRQLAGMARAESGCGAPWRELTLYLMGDAAIAEIHRAVQGVDGSTDVITQRYEPVPGEPPGVYGEIFVNLQCACREGLRRAGWSPDKELALYIAHGCDHLNDSEDESDEGFRSMRSRELKWLEQLRLTPVIIKPIM